MSYFVSIRQHVPPDQLARQLEGIRSDLEASDHRHPGRRHARVFRSLDEPGHLLSVGEWESVEAFHAFCSHPAIREHVLGAKPPAVVEPLVRLRLIDKPAHHATAVACGAIDGNAETEDALEQFIMTQSRADVQPAPGLVREEVYRLTDHSGRFLLVHSWESQDALLRFRDATGDVHTALAAFGASIERFVGEVVAEYLRR